LLSQYAETNRSGSLSDEEKQFIEQLCIESAQKQEAAVLLRALGDESSHQIRRFAAKSLGELGNRFEINQKEIVINLMEVAASDQDSGTRWRATWALGAMRPIVFVKTVVTTLCNLLDDNKEYDSIRWRAAWALGEIKAESALDLLTKIATDENEAVSVRRAAIRALGAIQSPEAELALKRLCQDDEKKIRELARWALGEILGRDYEEIDTAEEEEYLNEEEIYTAEDEKYLSAETLARLRQIQNKEKDF
jgi:HEAT repeat protein